VQAGKRSCRSKEAHAFDLTQAGWARLARKARHKVLDASNEMRALNPGSRITYPGSRIAYPASRDSHPVSRIPHPFSLFRVSSLQGKQQRLCHGRLHRLDVRDINRTDDVLAPEAFCPLPDSSV
jgi:hypothetical protein